MLDIAGVVTGGLCIGCGLCAGIAGRGRLSMLMTPEGRERPVADDGPLPDAILERINAVCPGTRIEGARPETLPADAEIDPVWGPVVPSSLAIVHASDSEVRYRGASGGVLTALGQYLLGTNEVAAVLHVKATPDAPMRSVATVSETPDAVLDAAGSRYGPAAVLVNLEALLARGVPFAVIAKPCDIGAVRRMMEIDDRARKLVRYCLTLVCGGASDLGKSRSVLDHLGVAEEELRLFRYRGHGNPGLTRIETRDGCGFELTYRDMWADEGAWGIQPRCKICPDAIGEAADLVASDCWPGADPDGDDDGFNAVMARTETGRRLFEGAVADGVLTVARTIGVRDMDHFQPHQVRKKRAVWARLEGMRAAGMAVPAVHRLRIEELATLNDEDTNQREMEGARKRAATGRLGEPPAVAAD